MTTTDHPCIERLRPLLEQRRQVDGVLWVLHGLIYLAVALSLVEIVATLVLDGEGASNAAASVAEHPAWLSTLGINRFVVILAGLVIAMTWTSRRNKLDLSFGSDLRNPETVAIPPLDGEIMVGMRCTESSAARYRWTACKPIWKTLLVRTLAVFVFLLPNLTEFWINLFSNGSEKEVGWFSLVLKVGSLAIMLFFVVLAFVERRVQEITIERGTGDPRLRITLAGLVSMRKIDAPRSAIVKFDFDKALQLEYRDEATGKDRRAMLLPPSSMLGAFDTWQYKRLFRELRAQFGLPDASGAPGPGTKVQPG
jgi:hypothetical protein